MVCSEMLPLARAVGEIENDNRSCGPAYQLPDRCGELNPVWECAEPRPC